MTYGAIVVQLLRDNRDDCDVVNLELHRMGYNIGVRLIDEYLVQTQGVLPTCSSIHECAEAISKVGLKMFLGITGDIVNFDDERKAFRIRLPNQNNPFVDFVELPDKCKTLVYGNLLCGVLRGALESIRMNVDVYYVSDVLRGDEHSEIEVVLKDIIQERIKSED